MCVCLMMAREQDRLEVCAAYDGILNKYIYYSIITTNLTAQGNPVTCHVFCMHCHTMGRLPVLSEFSTCKST